MAISSTNTLVQARRERRDAIAFMPALRAFFRRQAHGDDVEDLVQEVLIRMHGCREARIDNYESYVFRVARNVLRDRYRRDHVRRRSDHCELVEQDHPPDEMSPERILWARQQLQSAMAAMNELPERSRRILVLLRWEGLSYNEVAELLDISVSAVQKHVTRSMRHLMTRLLESHEPQDESVEPGRDGHSGRLRVVRAADVARGDIGRRACC